MRISEKIMLAAEKQLDADCGIGENREHVVKAANGILFCRAPRFPEKGYLTAASFGELVRQAMQKETGMQARIYEGIDPFFRGILCGGRVRIMAADEIFDWCVREYGSLKHPEWLGQFSGLRALDGKLRRYGRRIEDVRLNFLPGGKKEERDRKDSFPFEIRWMEEGDLAGRRGLAAFRHAVCGSELTPDVLAAAALKDGRIVGMAGATQDCGLLWQIGVDVDEAYRGRGIATVLVRLLKEEILRRGKIPFYATSQSHILSMDTALGAGFLPAWTEIYAAASRSGR